MEGPDIYTATAAIDNGRFGSRSIRFETGRPPGRSSSWLGSCLPR